MSRGQGEIPLLGEMSAERTKGSAVFAEEAVSGEEGAVRAERCKGCGNLNIYEQFLMIEKSVYLCYNECRL